jgi:hypothetical protein
MDNPVTSTGADKGKIAAGAARSNTVGICMDRSNALNFSRSDTSVPYPTGVFEHDLSEVELDLVRNKGVGLILALIVSLGLWAMIWLAIATLFGVGPF